MIRYLLILVGRAAESCDAQKLPPDAPGENEGNTPWRRNRGSIRHIRFASWHYSSRSGTYCPTTQMNRSLSAPGSTRRSSGRNSYRRPVTLGFGVTGLLAEVLS